MTTSDDMTSAATGPGAVFSRVLVGVDGSAESREAVRQAAALVEGELTLLAVYDTVSAYSVTTGTIPSPLLDPDVQRAAAEGVFRGAEEALGPIEATAKVARAARGTSCSTSPIVSATRSSSSARTAPAASAES